MEKIVTNIHIEKLHVFETLFTTAFEKIKAQFSVDTWKFIYLLIDRTDSSTIKDFFTDREKQESDLLLKKRYKQLNEVLTEKMYFESEAERHQGSTDD
ncbi:hypothetical protein [Paenibacillus sp. N3.4]|uniref:hypothetical protein n=1 Tax=Paenibacillus sp. N3.4 TaxID=2603222 RepID=UPI0011CA00CE|nr:hypothetical protein [Paenibacillus sp. N3.4]TXK84293.1 hypothetical protein FU659_09605 [Paenibacillus sp. N3.4]